MTQGAMAVDDLLLTLTVLTNEPDSATVKEALNDLRSTKRGT